MFTFDTYMGNDAKLHFSCNKSRLQYLQSLQDVCVNTKLCVKLCVNTKCNRKCKCLSEISV